MNRNTDKKRTIIWSVVILLAVGAAGYLCVREAKMLAGDTGDVVGTVSFDQIDAAVLYGDPQQTGSETLEHAREDFQLAAVELERAEDELEVLQERLKEVENYIEKLEGAGEDPAEYTTEGIQMLQPIIEDYELKIQVVTAAEEKLKQARDALEQLKAK